MIAVDPVEHPELWMLYQQIYPLEPFSPSLASLVFGKLHQNILIDTLGFLRSAVFSFLLCQLDRLIQF